MQGMKIDFITNSIIITKSFAEAAADINSEEYTSLQLAKMDNPTMRVVLRSTRATGHGNDYKGLTYKYMRKFISVMDSENLINFEKTILHYESYGYENGTVYKCVRDWFLKYYPDHRKMIAAAAPAPKIETETVALTESEAA